MAAVCAHRQSSGWFPWVEEKVGVGGSKHAEPGSEETLWEGGGRGAAPAGLMPPDSSSAYCLCLLLPQADHNSAWIRQRYLLKLQLLQQELRACASLVTSSSVPRWIREQVIQLSFQGEKNYRAGDSLLQGDSESVWDCSPVT